MIDLIITKFNYWLYIIIMMLGLYAMISKRNYVKKLIGMSIFQTAIILFFVSTGVKREATIPIIGHHAEQEEAQIESSSHNQEEIHPTPPEGDRYLPTNPSGHGIQARDYANPLPHVLMLTAIVVGVATLGVGLAVCEKIYEEYGTIEEHEIMEKIKAL